MSHEIRVKGIALLDAALGGRAWMSVLPSRSAENVQHRLVGQFILKVASEFPDKGQEPQRQRLHVLCVLGYR